MAIRPSPSEEPVMNTRAMSPWLTTCPILPDERDRHNLFRKRCEIRTSGEDYILQKLVPVLGDEGPEHLRPVDEMPKCRPRNCFRVPDKFVNRGLAQSAALRPINKTDIRRADYSQQTSRGNRRCWSGVGASARKISFAGGHDQR